MRTGLYVDGFNLYYGAAKNTRFKWVNVVALAETVLPGLSVSYTRYFTALVKAGSLNPQQLQRQQTYLRALQTLPNLTVHLGHYLRSEVMMPMATPPPAFAKVVKMEEKGSDVNLATYMLVDAFRDQCDQVVVITNDSDLAEPVRIIHRDLKKRVLVLNPHSVDTAARASVRTGRKVPARPSVTLGRAAHRVKDIRSDGPSCAMALSQFSPTLMDAQGRTIHKPDTW